MRWRRLRSNGFQLLRFLMGKLCRGKRGKRGERRIAFGVKKTQQLKTQKRKRNRHITAKKPNEHHKIFPKRNLQLIFQCSHCSIA